MIATVGIIKFEVDYDVSAYDGIELTEVAHKGVDLLAILDDATLDSITDQVDQHIREQKAWTDEKEEYLADARYEELTLGRMA